MEEKDIWLVEDDGEQKKAWNKTTWLLTVVLVLSLLLTIVVTVFGAMRTTDTIPSEPVESTVIEKIQEIRESVTTKTTQETEEVTETTESTAAPEIDIPATIVPATEEPIHIEVTEAPSEAPSVSVEPDISTDVGMSDVEMLACVIYQEAGGDLCCDDCRRRVADVVLNRVESEWFPNTIYDVLTQEAQYGRFCWTGIVWPDRADNPGEAHAVERAYRIAEEVLNGQHSELYGNGYVWQAEFPQGDTIYCCGIYFGR